MEDIPLLLQFASKYKIPWILKWQYNLPPSNQPPTVTRIFFIKWWDKFDINRIFRQVQTEFPPSPAKEISSSSKPKVTNIAGSSSSLAGTIAGVEDFSVTELNLLAQAIRARVSSLKEDSASSQSSSSASVNQDIVNLQDAQDPYA